MLPTVGTAYDCLGDLVEGNNFNNFPFGNDIEILFRQLENRSGHDDNQLLK